MKKIMTKIVGAFLGVAMAIGVGAFVANNREATEVNAAEGSTHNFSNVAFSQLLNNNASISSVTIPQQSYTVKTIAANVRYNKAAGGVTITPTIGSTVLEPQTHNANSTVDLTWTVDPAVQGSITFDFVNNCGNGTGKGTFYFNSVTLTEGPGGSIDPNPTTYTVSFNGNGAEGNMDDVTDVSGTYTLPDNGFTVPTGKSFDGWKAENAGNTIAAGATYDVGSDVTFFAQWSDTKYTVTYHDNEKTGGSAPSSTSHTYGTEVKVKGNDGSLVRTGYEWFGWSLNEDGSGTVYGPAFTDKYTIGTSNIDFYPIWVANPSLPSYDNGSLAFHFAGSTVHGNNTGYSNRSASVATQTDSKYSNATWQITVGNNTAQLGTNAKDGNLSKTTLGNGNYDAASGIANALGIETTTQKYSAAICTTPMSYIYGVDLLYSGTNGGEPTSAWILSSTDGLTWEVETRKVWNIVNDSSFVFAKNTDARQYAFVAYWNLTNSGGLKGFELKLYGEFPLEQTVTGPTSAYLDEEVTLTTTAENPTWSISDTYTTAEGASVTNDGVVSATGEGTVEVKVSAEGYEDAFHSIYFSVRPADAYVTPNPSVINGFTGQSVNVTFTYGNVKTSFYAMSRNLHVCDVNDFDCGASSGSFRVDLVGAGSTTVKFYDGSVEIGSIAVTVEQSTVSFTGFPTLGQLAPGETQDMMKSIIVNTTGTCTDALSWESDNESVATVDANGVVAAVAEGQANITATSIDYPSTTATCTFTVLKSKFKPVDAFVDGKKYILAAEGKDDPSHILYLPAGTSEVEKNPVENGTFSTSWFTESMAWTATINEQSEIVFSNTYEGNTYYLNATADSAQAISISTTSLGSWKYDGTGLKFNDINRYLACYDDKDFRQYSNPESNKAKTVNKFYEYITDPKEDVENLDTTTSLAYRYEKDGEGNFSYSDIVMRFGANISKDLWNELDTNEHNITGFGVVLMDGGLVTTKDEMDYAIANGMVSSTVSENLGEHMAIDYFVPVADMNETIGETENSYFWNLRVSVNEADINEYFTAVAYIKVGDEYIFLNMARESVSSVAKDYLDNRGYTTETADGSLANLAA